MCLNASTLPLENLSSSQERTIIMLVNYRPISLLSTVLSLRFWRVLVDFLKNTSSILVT